MYLCSAVQDGTKVWTTDYPWDVITQYQTNTPTPRPKYLLRIDRARKKQTLQVQRELWVETDNPHPYDKKPGLMHKK